MLHKIGAFLKRNIYLYTMILSLLLPDALLRIQSWAHHVQALTGIGILFTGFWAALFVLACVGFMSKKWGRGVYLTVVSIMTIFMVSAYIYYTIFNRYFWLDAIGMAGEAMNYSSYILKSLTWHLLLPLALQLFLIFVTCRLWRPERFKTSGLWLIVPLLCLVTLHTFMMTETATSKSQDEMEFNRAKTLYREFSDPNRSMQAAGPYQYIFRNLVRLVFPEASYDDTTISEVEEYFAEKPVSGPNDYTGIFEGKNVIMVMLESIDDWMIDEQYTPTMLYMMENGLNFTDHFACTFGTGYTFNTEFAVNTGYHATLVGSPVSELTESTFPHTLARAFKAKGYTAREVHYNGPDFYNRGKMHTVFGYEEYISYQKYLPLEEAECDSKAIRNQKVYREIVPLQEQPFLNYVVTYSAHLPYTSEDRKVKKIKGMYPAFVDSTMDEEINNAMIMAHDTDEFFRILLEKLEQDGLAEDTVIVAFGDHFTYGMSNWEKLYTIGDVKTSDMLERTPFFIYCKGMEGKQITKVTNTLDILPTVINLFGLEKTPYWMGEDAMDPNYAGYAYFSSGSWYDGELHYYADENLEAYPPEKLVYIDAMNRSFDMREKVNEIVLRTDYFGPKEEQKTP